MLIITSSSEIQMMDDTLPKKPEATSVTVPLMLPSDPISVLIVVGEEDISGDGSVTDKLQSQNKALIISASQVSDTTDCSPPKMPERTKSDVELDEHLFDFSSVVEENDDASQVSDTTDCSPPKMPERRNSDVELALHDDLSTVDVEEADNVIKEESSPEVVEWFLPLHDLFSPKNRDSKPKQPKRRTGNRRWSSVPYLCSEVNDINDLIPPRVQSQELRWGGSCEKVGRDEIPSYNKNRSFPKPLRKYSRKETI